MPDTTAATLPVIYECPDCGERTTQHRCPDCNLFTRRLGTGGTCPSCGETITLAELREETPTN